jgi:hypothetical protein
MNFVVFLAARGKHDDRHDAEFADLAAGGEPVELGIMMS